jgi:hypothetical protein
MGGIRSKLASVLLRSRKLQIELDIWRLYHVVYYYEQCGGKEIRVPMPPEISFRKQKQRIKFNVKKQLIASLSALNGCDTEVVRDFNLVVKSATKGIPGVFLEGSAVPGTVLCFFPGTVFQRAEMSQLMQSAANSQYLMSRSDGCVVDASEYHPGSQALEENPLAIGHLIRHPDTADNWNVLPYSYTVPPDFPHNIISLVPNRYYSPPSFLQTKQLKTIVFVAAKHIRNEDLFLK